MQEIQDPTKTEMQVKYESEADEVNPFLSQPKHGSQDRYDTFTRDERIRNARREAKDILADQYVLKMHERSPVRSNKPRQNVAPISTPTSFVLPSKTQPATSNPMYTPQGYVHEPMKSEESIADKIKAIPTQIKEQVQSRKRKQTQIPTKSETQISTESPNPRRKRQLPAIPKKPETIEMKPTPKEEKETYQPVQTQETSFTVPQSSSLFPFMNTLQKSFYNPQENPTPIQPSPTPSEEFHTAPSTPIPQEPQPQPTIPQQQTKLTDQLNQDHIHHLYIRSLNPNDNY